MAETKVNLSIHPRNWPQGYMRGREKQNTSGKKSRGTLERTIAGIEGHLERHRGDSASQRHLSTLKSKLAAL